MKRGLNILMIVCTVLAMMSCSKTKSYTDMLNDQEDAIDDLIAKKNLEILSKYPSDSVFKENQFVKLDNGVYLNVIDSGTGPRAEMNRTDVLMRFTATYFMLPDTDTVSNYGPHSSALPPVEFIYGGYEAISGSWTTDNIDYLNSMLSEGLQTPLQYVGNRAKVKIIVPFQIGNQYDLANGIPVYFEIVEYKFLE